MAVALRRSASFSTGSTAWSNFQTSGGGQSIGGDFAASMDLLSLFPPSYEMSVCGSEKLTMQNLNSRLAAYLEKVVSLKTTNLKLEQKIKEFYESRTFTSRKDLSKYYSIIEDLEKQIISKAKEKHLALLKLDNVNLTASDFKLKFESERNLHLTVEADLARLRMVLGETKMANEDLQIQLAGLQEELIFLKKSHEEDLYMARSQQSGAINVQVDCAQAVNLDKELEEMRQQYEALILKNSKQIEQWFHTKVKNLNTEVIQSHTEITSSKTSSSELRKTYQTLEIEIKGIYTQIQTLQNDLTQVGGRHGEQISQLQLYIDRLQTELQQITANIHHQALEYQQLLDIKMRLELEIAEYRRLLGGEEHGYSIHETDSSKITTVSKTVTQTVVEEKQETQQVEEEHHLHQRRVKIITEELVDGVVVAMTTDEKVQDLPN